MIDPADGSQAEFALHNLILRFDGKWIFKDSPRRVEADAMLTNIFSGFDFVPLEEKH